MFKKGVPVYFYAVAAMLFWGMSFVWTSMLLSHYEPITIIFIRLVISSLFLFILLYASGKLQKIHKRHYGLFFLSALFNPFLYFLRENYGVKFSSSTIAAIVIATIPVFTPIAGYLVFKERLRWSTFLGIALSFIGIGMMLLTNNLELEVSFWGILFLMIAVVAAIFYSVMLKKLTAAYSPTMIVSIQNLLGIFLFLPLFLLFEMNEAIRVPINAEIVWSFLLLAILASSLSFVFFTHTIKKLGISKANIFSNLIPVFTAIFSFILLDEHFTLRKIMGMILVIGGVMISEMRKERKPKILPS